MLPEERDPAYLLDIVLAARRAIGFLGDRDADTLAADEVVLSAIEHSLIVIGEAAGRVSPSFRDQHPDIALGKATGMRNFLVHDYGRIDVAEVWRTVHDDLPGLIAALEALLPPEPADA